MLRFKRGQLSLEFIILMLVVLVGGAIVVSQIGSDYLFKGEAVKEVKKEVGSIYIKRYNFSTAGKNITNKETIINETTENNNTNNTTTEQNITNNETINLPDLVPISLVIIDNNTKEHICGQYKERVQNSGEDTQLQNRCRHGKCDNNTPVIIEVNITNQGTANVSKQFIVTLYDNGIPIENKTVDGLAVNEIKTVTFDYIISTHTGHGYRHRNGNEYGNTYRYGNENNTEEEYYHNITVSVDSTNVINEINENNNNISVVIGINYPSTINNTDENGTAEVEGLFIKINGNGYLKMQSNPIDGAKYIGPDIDIHVPGNRIYFFNLEGVINNGRIKVNGNGDLYLGNIKYINNLYLRLNGNSNIDFDSIKDINTLYFITNKAFNKKVIEIGDITGNVNVNLTNKTINDIKIRDIKGNAELYIVGGDINNMEISGQINGNGLLIIENSTVQNLDIQKNNGVIIIINSYIETLNVNNYEIIEFIKSTIAGGNINNYRGEIINYDSNIGANINK